MYKILGHSYTIKSVVDSHFEGAGAGSISCNSLIIKISNVVPQSRKEEALLHETFEALNYHLELGLEHGKITALCEGLYQVLRGNNMLNEDSIKKLLIG